MTEEIIEAIFSQIKPIESVYLKPRQKGSKIMSLHAIITFKSDEDAEFVMAKGPKTKSVLDLFLSPQHVAIDYFRPIVTEKQQKIPNKPNKYHTIRKLPNESLPQAQQVKILANEVVVQPPFPLFQNNGFPLMHSQLINTNQQYTHLQNYFTNQFYPFAPTNKKPKKKKNFHQDSRKKKKVLEAKKRPNLFKKIIKKETFRTHFYQRDLAIQNI